MELTEAQRKLVKAIKGFKKKTGVYPYISQLVQLDLGSKQRINAVVEQLIFKRVLHINDGKGSRQNYFEINWRGIMEPAIIAGGCAFLGAVIGQLVNRNTQRETWLLQKRAEVFSKYLIDVEDYDNTIQRILNTCGLDTLDGSREQAVAFNKLALSENIVCFYLSDTSKIEFRKLVDDIKKFTPDFDFMIEEYNTKQVKEAYQKLYNLQDQLQKLFEQNLSKISWYK